MPVEQCLDLSVLKRDDLLLTLIDHAVACGDRMCHGWGRRDMFGAEIDQCSVSTDEIKRLR